MTVDNPVEVLRSQILALNDNTSEKCKAGRVATSRMFGNMSELFDTALIRTPGMVDQLWNNKEKREKTRFEHVKPSSEPEALLVFNGTLVSCTEGLQAVNKPLYNAVVEAFRKCGQQQVPEGKIQEKAQALYNQLMREPVVLSACFCNGDSEAKSLFKAESGCIVKAFSKLKNVPMDSIQESIATAARSRGQFAVGGVNGVSHEVFDTKVSFLEPFSEPFLSNMSNLVAHVWHLIRDAMTTMPEEQRTELKSDIYEKLWPFRRQHVSAISTDDSSARDSTLDATADATAEVVRSHYQRLLTAQPDTTGTVLSPEELCAKVKAHLKDLLVKWQKAISPGSRSFNCATHIVAVHSGVFVAVVQLRSAGTLEPLSVEVHPHDIRTPTPLWVGSKPRAPGSGVIWERFSALAMRALCYYMDRAKIAGDRHPGAQAIFDLMMWFATYCEGPALTLGASDASASKLDSDRTDTVQAGPETSKVEWGRKVEKPVLGLHTHGSAMSVKPFGRDPETNSMLPAIWRPYRVPSTALCWCVANNKPVQYTVASPLHFSEVEPEHQ